MLQQYQVDLCKNAINKRKPIEVFIQKQMYILEVKVRGKSREQPTIGAMFGFDILSQIIIADWTNKKIHLFRTPFTTATLLHAEPLSELENTVAELVARGVVSEKYVVDLFTQEAFFETKRAELESKYDGKEILVCGGEIFVGDDINQLVDNASIGYPNRPFFSYSLKHEYSTF